MSASAVPAPRENTAALGPRTPNVIAEWHSVMLGISANVRSGWNTLSPRSHIRRSLHP
jgi:hypothetical protein